MSLRAARALVALQDSTTFPQRKPLTTRHADWSHPAAIQPRILAILQSLKSVDFPLVSVRHQSCLEPGSLRLEASGRRRPEADIRRTRAGG